MGARRFRTGKRHRLTLGVLGGLAAACSGLALSAAPASAFLVHPASQTLSDGNAASPQVVADESDRATIVWYRSNRIESVRLDADGTPEPVQTLAPAGEGTGFPEAAIDGSDRATIVWYRSDGIKNRIQSVRLDADGTPEPVQTLSAAGQNAASPEVAIDALDRATIVWWRADGANSRIQSVRLDADGTPGPVQTLSAAGQGGASPEVAIDGTGRATIVWVRSDVANKRIQSVRLDADGTPEPVQTLSEAGQSAASPQVAIDGTGRATIVWVRSDGANSRIQSVRLDADGTPGTVKTLSAAGLGVQSPQVAVDDKGRATIVWEAGPLVAGDSRIQLVRLGSRGTAGAVRTLSEQGDGGSSGPHVTIDGSDRATVVWEGSVCCSSGIVELVRVTADGVVSRVYVVGGGGFHSGTPNPQVAIDGSLRPTIAWPEFVQEGWYAIEAVRAEIVYPETTITKGGSKQVHRSKAKFKFESSVSRFECRLDSRPFKGCASPKSYRNLAEGRHSFAVRAIDSEGDADPTPAERSFTVDTVQGSVSAKKTQKQGRSMILVRAKARGKESLVARARGRIRVGKRSYTLKPSSKNISPGRSKDLKLKPRRSRDARKIARALDRGKKATAKLTLKLTDKAGNRETNKLKVKLKR